MTKSFAQGVLTFDGGIHKTGIVGFSTRSQQMYNDLLEILDSDGIQYTTQHNHGKEFWSFQSRSGRKKETLKKWIPYFIPHTSKYHRLFFFTNNKKYSKDYVFKLFPKHYKTKLSVQLIYEIAQKIDSFDAKLIKKELDSKDLTTSYESIFKYLYIAKRIKNANNNPLQNRTLQVPWQEALRC